MYRNKGWKKESIKTEITQESYSELKLKNFKDKLRIIENELFNENIEFYFPRNPNYNLTIGELKEIIRRECHIPFHRQRLLFNDTEFSDENEKIINVCFYGIDICTNNNVMKTDFINIKVIDHINNNSVNLRIDIYWNLQEKFLNWWK